MGVVATTPSSKKRLQLLWTASAVAITIGFVVSLILASRVWEAFQDGDVIPRHWEFPSKCFDCERQMPPELRYMAQQTKCFSCEREMAKVSPDHALGTHPQKCFDCETAPLRRLS